MRPAVAVATDTAVSARTNLQCIARDGAAATDADGAPGHAAPPGTAVTGARLLVGAPTAFDCTIEEMIDRATHTIVIGRVQAIRSTPGAGALTYWHGAYRALAD